MSTENGLITIAVFAEHTSRAGEYCYDHEDHNADDTQVFSGDLETLIDVAASLWHNADAYRHKCGRTLFDELSDPFGDLADYITGKYIRPATKAELAASREAGSEGVFLLASDGSILSCDDPGADDARRCYVQEQ